MSEKLTSDEKLLRDKDKDIGVVEVKGAVNRKREREGN